MSIIEDIQKLAPGSLVEMFELDVSGITGTDTPADHSYFHAGTNGVGGNIVWQGKTYQRFPVEAEGFDVVTRGTQPRPKLRASNVLGAMSALVMAMDDLVLAKVIRRRTYAQYLDGMPGADPNQYLPDHVFYVERKVSENKNLIEWELSSILDLEGVQLPSRTITVDYCQSDYRSAECSYTGTSYFNVLDAPVGSLALDVCSKRVSGCKARFGARAVLPFGGFPAAKSYKY